MSATTIETDPVAAAVAPLGASDIGALMSRMAACMREGTVAVVQCADDGRAIGLRTLDPRGISPRAQHAAALEIASAARRSHIAYAVLVTAGEPTDGLLLPDAATVELARAELQRAGVPVRAAVRVEHGTWRSYDDPRTGTCTWWAGEDSEAAARADAARALAPQPGRFPAEISYLDASARLSRLTLPGRTRAAWTAVPQVGHLQHAAVDLACLLADHRVRDVTFWRLVVDRGVPGEPGPRAAADHVVDALTTAARITPRRHRTALATVAGGCAYLVNADLASARVLLENAIACGHGTRLAEQLLEMVSARVDPAELPRHSLLSQAEDAVFAAGERAA